MSNSYSFMQREFHRPTKRDSFYPAVIADSQDDLVLPIAGAAASLDTSDWHINVSTRCDPGAGHSDVPPRVASRVHIERGIPSLLIRHQYKREAHVLFIPLLTATIKSYLESVREANSVMKLKFEGASRHVTDVSVFRLGQSLEQAIGICLNLETHQDIAAAMTHIIEFAELEHPNSVYDNVSFTSVLCVPESIPVQTNENQVMPPQN